MRSPTEQRRRRRRNSWIRYMLLIKYFFDNLTSDMDIRDHFLSIWHKKKRDKA